MWSMLNLDRDFLTSLLRLDRDFRFELKDFNEELRQLLFSVSNFLFISKTTKILGRKWGTMWFVHIKLSLLIVYSLCLYMYIISTTSGMLTKILSYLSVKKSPDRPILCVLQILKIFQILSLWLCYLRQNKRKIEVASILFILLQKSVPYWSLFKCECYFWRLVPIIWMGLLLLLKGLIISMFVWLSCLFCVFFDNRIAFQKILSV